MKFRNKVRIFYQINNITKNIMKPKSLLLALVLGASSVLTARTTEPDPTQDTATLSPVIIISFKSERAKKQFWKDYKRVQRVYPYAYKAQKIMDELNEKSKDLSSREKNRLMKSAEEQIKEYLTPKIKEMSMKDGILLVKLLDRQTHRTGYALVKDFRNGLTDWTYHKIGIFFGQNIKDTWDPKGRDKQLERVVKYYERCNGLSS